MSLATEATGTGSQPIALDLLATLILDLDERQVWLNDREPTMRRLFDDAFLLIGGLRNESGWKVGALLGELGCRKRSRAQLEKLGQDQLENCCAFFEWLTDMLHVTPPDRRVKRALISKGSELYADARMSLDDCRQAMARPIGVDDPLTPLDLVRLGEIGVAFQVARSALASAAGERARAFNAANKFSELPMVHIRTTTFDALLTRSIDLKRSPLGIERAARLAHHILQCRACHEACVARGEALGLGKAAKPFSFETVPTIQSDQIPTTESEHGSTFEPEQPLVSSVLAGVL